MRSTKICCRESTTTIWPNRKEKTFTQATKAPTIAITHVD
jgi:hypothetical protein